MKTFTNFIEFIRQQGVIGLAIGLILGDAVSGLVRSLINSIIDPLLGLILGSTEGLAFLTTTIGGAELQIGSFLAALIDFVVIAFVVYFIFKGLRLEKLDATKSKKEKFKN